VRILSHWFIGRINGSLIEPHERTGLNRITQTYHLDRINRSNYLNRKTESQPVQSSHQVHFFLCFFNYVHVRSFYRYLMVTNFHQIIGRIHKMSYSLQNKIPHYTRSSGLNPYTYTHGILSHSFFNQPMNQIYLKYNSKLAQGVHEIANNKSQLYQEKRHSIKW
jgi:hypothetical protein